MGTRITRHTKRYILTTKGNVAFNATGIDSVPVLKQFNERFGTNQTGLLKTTAPTIVTGKQIGRAHV